MMTKRSTLNLPEDYAVVLQQIKESEEEDFINLAQALHFNKPRLAHILRALQHKGLILINSRYADTMIQLSNKGKRLVTFMWPDNMQRI